MTDEREQVLDVARRGRAVANAVRQLTRHEKDAAILAIADALDARTPEIVAANDIDVARAKDAGTPEGIIDRLTLNDSRVAAIADALREVAALPDPCGEVVRGYTLPNGLQIRQVRVPMGVVGMIYEARPNVTVDAAGLCLKSGNVALLRGSSSAATTNAALVEIMRDAIVERGIPADAIQLVPGLTHESTKHLMTARGLVDVLIPRGGAALINNVVENSTVPVIETGVGNCHVYIDKDADIQKAINIIVNSKVQRPSVCNAAETLLVHKDIADTFLPLAAAVLHQNGVTLHADQRAYDLTVGTGIPVEHVTDEDWALEYLTLDLAAGVVDSIDEAIAHIQHWSSGHTESIVTDSQASAAKFVAGIDSAAVMINASTRFTDGGEFGFGAEIGISTQKLHARGPMGLAELTTTTYVVTGDGHIRG